MSRNKGNQIRRYNNKSLKKRLQAHLANVLEGNENKKIRRNHRVNWLRSLVKRGLVPLIEDIEEPTEDWAIRERYWISYFRSQGCDLVNTTGGGEGLMNPTKSVRKKLAKALRKRWGEGRLKIRKLSKAQKLHLRNVNLGRKASKATCGKLSYSLKKAWKRRKRNRNFKIKPLSIAHRSAIRKSLRRTFRRRRKINGGKVYIDRSLSKAHKQSISRGSSAFSLRRSSVTVLSAQSICRYRILTPCHNRTTHEGMTFGLSPGGYDLRIEFDSKGQIDVMEIPAGGFALASTIERFRMPRDVQGIVHDKSSWARRGLSVFNTVIEPGWNGYLTLELANHSGADIFIKRGMPIAQVVFHKLDAPAEFGYSGKYQDQERGPQRAK